MQKISENFTLREATYSQVALMNGIDNTPNEAHLKNIKDLAENVLEPLRKGLGNRPIRLSSWFRCRRLNAVIGGAPRSQHMADAGAAADIDNDGIKTGPTNAEIFHYIKDNIAFDQLIWEYGDDNNPGWVHVSYYNGQNRGQILKCKAGKYYEW